MNRTRTLTHLSFLAALLLFVISPPPCADATEPPAKKSIRVVASVYEPFVVQKGTAITGFDVDLLDTICRLHGIEYAIRLTSFKEMLDDVAAGRADMAIGCVYVTKERATLFHFTKPYLMGGLVMAVPTSRPLSSVDELDGKRLGVKLDATGERFARRLVAKGTRIRVVPYEATIDSFQALARGELDAVFNDYYNTILLIQRLYAGEISVAKNIWGVRLYDTTPIAYPVRRGNEWLTAILDDEIVRLESMGFRERLLAKWFPVQHPVNWPRFALYGAGAVLALGALIALALRRRQQALRTRALEEAAHRFGSLVMTLPLAVFILEHGRILHANTEAGRLMGLHDASESDGKDFDSFFQRSDAGPAGAHSAILERDDPADDADAGGGADTETPIREMTWRRYDGAVTPVLCAVHRIEWMGRRARALFAQDLSDYHAVRAEKERLTGLLAQSQKMEAIGQLAGGVAHDFNNLLTGIMGHADMALLDASDEGQRTPLRHILNAAQRAAELTAKLLTFARRGPMRAAPIHLHAIVDEAIALLPQRFGSAIAITRRLDAERDLVMGDATFLVQVMVNLLINAHDAMDGAGAVTIATDTIVIDERRRALIGCAGTGPHIRLSFTDTGCGIAAADLPRIFEPFYTTKASGKGTGLGLAMAYGIVKQHGGELTVESETGRGTTFTLYLPLTEGDVEADRPHGPAALPAGDMSGHIAVIDDEEAVVSYLERLLERGGYAVTSFIDPSAGLAWLRDHYETVDAVLLDVIMPQLDGAELVRVITTERPGLPVLLMSGHVPTEAEVRLGDFREHAASFLAKPLRSAEVLDAIAAALRDKR
ncbi:MAG TPA: transporter substrate-binding domain-containing protein [Spirochaetota bacterium]|nr:transporter substrate-binding domain-containing protein [Spirochaetota bacterium]